MIIIPVSQRTCMYMLTFQFPFQLQFQTLIIPICHNLSSLMLLLLSHFSCVRLCATPSLGFPRQEHWSGLPFPSPKHKSEK